ncbi:MAG: DinB family protein [Rubricoccaceae bacterium]
MLAPPPSGLAAELRLRHELAALVRSGQAHAGPIALDGLRGADAHRRVPGHAHTAFELVWHLRFAQDDILAFVRDPAYVAPPWPEAYWPAAADAAAPGAWPEAVRSFRAGLAALEALAREADLFAELPHAPGYTVLRELLLAADHNAHHLGQLIALRRALGAWPPPEERA